MTNEDVIRRCVKSGIDAYLEAQRAGMDEESCFLFGKLAFDAEFQLELHSANLLLNPGPNSHQGSQ